MCHSERKAQVQPRDAQNQSEVEESLQRFFDYTIVWHRGARDAVRDEHLSRVTVIFRLRYAAFEGRDGNGRSAQDDGSVNSAQSAQPRPRQL